MTKAVSMLSQTAMNDFQRCQYRFKELWRDGVSRGEASLAMHAGHCFDAYARCHLNRQLDLDKELLDRDGRTPSDDAIEIGRSLFRAYEKCGALDALIKDGVAVVGPSKEIVLHGVPFAGIPDIILHNGVIVDWKTSGVGSKRGARPRPGYEKGWMWNGSDWYELPKHPQHGMYLEDIYDRWAKQILLYSALMGKPLPWRGLIGGVEGIFVDNGRIYIVRYRAQITMEFQERILRELVTTWDIIQREAYASPSFHPRKCHMWGRPCELVDTCPAYIAAHKTPKNWLEAMR